MITIPENKIDELVGMVIKNALDKLGVNEDVCVIEIIRTADNKTKKSEVELVTTD